MPGEILAAAARWQRRSSDANRLCCAVSPKSAGILLQYARILIPTDSAVRVLSPQPRSRSHRCADKPREPDQVMMDVYPPELRSWIGRRGGLTPRLLLLEGRERLDGRSATGSSSRAGDHSTMTDRYRPDTRCFLRQRCIAATCLAPHACSIFTQLRCEKIASLPNGRPSKVAH
jgi:hypothetical protein